MQVSLPLQLPADFYTVVGIGTLLAGFAAVIGLLITLRQNRDTNILGFLSETDKAITYQLECEKDLKDLEQCIVYAYNYLDIIDGIAFLRINGKIPDYLPWRYKSFFEYGITMMAWYSTIPEKPGSSTPYDKRTLTDNWPSLVKWLKEQQRHKEQARPEEQTQLKAYGIEHLPPKMVELLEVCKIDKLTLFSVVWKEVSHFDVA